MSTKLNETALLAEITSIIEGYGRDVVFFQTNRTSAYTAVKMTPPTRTVAMDNDNVPTETRIGIISASGLTWTPFHGQRVTDESLDYYVTDVKPISSGDTTQVYKITFQR